MISHESGIILLLWLIVTVVQQEWFEIADHTTRSNKQTCRVCQYWTLHNVCYDFFFLLKQCFSFLAAFPARLLLDSTILTNHKGLTDPGICHQPESHNFHLDDIVRV